MPVRREPETVLATYDIEDTEAAWDLIVDLTDWNRALLEAMGRHFDLEHGRDERDLEFYICGECLAEVLKCHYTYPKWKKDS